MEEHPTTLLSVLSLVGVLSLTQRKCFLIVNDQKEIITKPISKKKGGGKMLSIHSQKGKVNMKNPQAKKTQRKHNEGT